MRHLQAGRVKPIKQKASPLDTALCTAEIAVGQKALDVRVLDIKDVSNFADFFVIASGTSNRHIKGIVDKIIEAIDHSLQLKPSSICGYDHGEWILIDYGDVVIHIFYEQARQFYDFDELWSVGKLISLPQELEKHARMFRTGMY